METRISLMRYLPSKPLPSYIFIPGVNPHPKKAGGHMEGEQDPVAEPVSAKDPQKNEFFRYALDLFNHGYFWESHVYFEALWNAHKRQGSMADFFKGMIKLGASGVKLHLGQLQSYQGHLLRAQELFGAIKAKEGKEFLGFDLDEILSKISHRLGAIEKEQQLFPLHPHWPEG